MDFSTRAKTGRFELSLRDGSDRLRFRRRLGSIALRRLALRFVRGGIVSFDDASAVFFSSAAFFFSNSERAVRRSRSSAPEASRRLSASCSGPSARTRATASRRVKSSLRAIVALRTSSSGARSPAPSRRQSSDECFRVLESYRRFTRGALIQSGDVSESARRGVESLGRDGDRAPSSLSVGDLLRQGFLRFHLLVARFGPFRDGRLQAFDLLPRRLWLVRRAILTRSLASRRPSAWRSPSWRRPSAARSGSSAALCLASSVRSDAIAVPSSPTRAFEAETDARNPANSSSA